MRLPKCDCGVACGLMFDEITQKYVCPSCLAKERNNLVVENEELREEIAALRAEVIDLRHSTGKF